MLTLMDNKLGLVCSLLLCRLGQPAAGKKSTPLRCFTYRYFESFHERHVGFLVLLAPFRVLTDQGTMDEDREHVQNYCKQITETKITTGLGLLDNVSDTSGREKLPSIICMVRLMPLFL